MPTNINDHEGFDPYQVDRPTLIWDGDCGFCKRSVLRLVDEVGDRVRFVTYQAVHDRFDEFSADDFAQSVHLIDTDGRVYRGAAAIYLALDKKPGGSKLLNLYEKTPGFAAVSEWGYRRVANHRVLASKLTRWFL
ncbi:MAG: thiol-disulfide oxidoreductase DCC family protein [Persicimonas sp.]